MSAPYMSKNVEYTHTHTHYNIIYSKTVTDATK